eukprot:648465-Amphidinium_carterae.2
MGLPQALARTFASGLNSLRTARVDCVQSITGGSHIYTNNDIDNVRRYFMEVARITTPREHPPRNQSNDCLESTSIKMRAQNQSEMRNDTFGHVSIKHSSTHCEVQLWLLLMPHLMLLGPNNDKYQPHHPVSHFVFSSRLCPKDPHRLLDKTGDQWSNTLHCRVGYKL